MTFQRKNDKNNIITLIIVLNIFNHSSCIIDLYSASNFVSISEVSSSVTLNFFFNSSWVNLLKKLATYAQHNSYNSVESK